MIYITICDSGPLLCGFTKLLLVPGGGVPAGMDFSNEVGSLVISIERSSADTILVRVLGYPSIKELKIKASFWEIVRATLRSQDQRQRSALSKATHCLDIYANEGLHRLVIDRMRSAALFRSVSYFVFLSVPITPLPEARGVPMTFFQGQGVFQ